MSAQMQETAAAETSMLSAWRKQIFHSVPPLPSTVDLCDQTLIITGSNGGIGLEAARQFLQRGVAHLILGVRSQAKGDAAAADLRSEFPKAEIEVWLLDMESPDSVRSFAARCESLDRLDIAILNAGIAKIDFERTHSGKRREVTLQVNYLSTVLLSVLLVPILKAKAHQRPGRLTLVGSDNSYWVNLPETSGPLLDVIDTESTYQGMQQYSLSKLFLIMALPKISEMVSPDDIIVNYFNPGATRGTGLSRDAKGIIKVLVFLMGHVLGRTPVDSARQYLHAAVVLGKESHGSFTDFKIRPYPALMYTDAGRQKMDSLWKDTLIELGLSEESLRGR